MKFCPKCGNQLDDNAVFCPACGNPMTAGQPQPGYNPAPVYDPYDHTAEFDPKDISDNKVMCMLMYLMGTVGIIIALLAGKDSAFVAFHARQAVKFEVTNALLLIVSLILCWTFIIPIAGGICVAILFVLKIICFFQIGFGKAKEPAIIRSLGFLR